MFTVTKYGKVWAVEGTCTMAGKKEPYERAFKTKVEAERNAARMTKIETDLAIELAAQAEVAAAHAADRLARKLQAKAAADVQLSLF